MEVCMPSHSSGSRMHVLGMAHRLGDLRRLVKDYKRGAETVYPTGPYFKGGAYGTDLVLIPSQAEKNNPDFTGCSATALQ